jgi:hypothetical protein
MTKQIDKADSGPGIRIGPGGGTIPSRPLNPPGPVDKPPRLAGGQSNSHQVKFSGAGDAVNAHADTDNGTILYTAQLRLVFWGREWASGTAPVTMGAVVGAVQSIVTGPYLDALKQYGVSHARIDRIIDLSSEDPPNPYSSGDGEGRVGRLIDDGKVPEPDEDIDPALYVIFLPSSVAGADLGLPTGVQGHHGQLINIDWDDFRYDGVPVGWVGNNGSLDSITENFSHELVEALTDPDGSGWQIEPRSRFDWNEIADVCSSTYLLDGVSVSSYWSFTNFDVEWIWRPSRIEWLGGTDQDGNAWQMPRDAVMHFIRGGDKFRVHGASTGKDSFVGIYYLDAKHSYLATNMDGVPDDNLLALPQHPPT